MEQVRMTVVVLESGGLLCYCPVARSQRPRRAISLESHWTRACKAYRDTLIIVGTIDASLIGHRKRPVETREGNANRGTVGFGGLSSAAVAWHFFSKRPRND